MGEDTVGYRVVDGHNDVLLRVYEELLEGSEDEPAIPGGDVGSFLEGRDGHVDLPRALDGGLAAGFFAAFVSNDLDPDSLDLSAVDFDAGDVPPPVDPAVAARATRAQLALLSRWAAADDRFRIVDSIADFDACLAGDCVGAIPHVEGAGGIAADLSNLDVLVDAGLRSVGLVWSRPNAFARGVPFVHGSTPDHGPGLTDAGRTLVRACNDRGLIVDCAHLNAAGVRDVLAETEHPPVVSHAGVHEICPSSRNLTDGQLRAIADRDGIVGLTFATRFLHPDGDDDRDLPLSTLLDHLDHAVDVAGVEHVGLGSDFDGATVLSSVEDVAGLPGLFDAIEARGYSRRECVLLAHGNWRRVLAATWGD
ncbi:membrane dipeptidase [Halalkaliarchaeum desulfuricum]|uniref:Membrane dipeptidase n=1 Tax=Halalkaliarchaeum desulfuricum TaxID=2055893 RepID=A0A343TF87_9EURY|nr:dipeptidase [Halalkaliarchaeum desulfuricum]AUX07759.1 membrane dipeptidase [Halalkaliarchaeum desulfuricum]